MHREVAADVAADAAALQQGWSLGGARTHEDMIGDDPLVLLDTARTAYDIDSGDATTLPLPGGRLSAPVHSCAPAVIALGR
ncbi:MAG: hypothetical protein WKF82_04755 [Nocardioidaceae bacterium]